MSENQLIDAQEPRSLRAPSEKVANVGNLLQLAIQSGIGADQLEKLVNLQERVMATAAKEEFFRSMAGFHAECPVIGKNREAKIKTKTGGEYGYQYADLAMVADTIKPFCEKYGFSYSFKQRFEKGFVETICIVRHEGGHQEETSFSGPSESTSAMSEMQKAVAATTTARRLALTLAFGLSVGDDNDGRGNLPDEQPQSPRSQQTPRTPTRGQRQQANVTYAAVAALSKDWKGLIATEAEASDAKAFAAWVQSVCGREFGVMKKDPDSDRMLYWYADDLAKCNEAIRAAQGGE